jgi:DNA-directed RNA polymerase specialized sigma24 family protein
MGLKERSIAAHRPRNRAARIAEGYQRNANGAQYPTAAGQRVDQRCLPRRERAAFRGAQGGTKAKLAARRRAIHNPRAVSAVVLVGEPAVLPEGSVTHQISRLKEGDHAAARILWQRYFQRLVRLARRKLQPHARRAADEEDVALTAFAPFCRHAEQGRFPKVRNRVNLWRLLVTLTIHMAIDQVRREHCQKRGGLPPDESASSATGRPAARRSDADQQPTPEFVAQMAEECERLLGGLDDETLKSIAVWKSEGFTNK